jgi:putative phage-type endonuclease
MLQRIRCHDRQSWLNERKNGIGGSEISCVLGLNKWKTNAQLWEEKTGRKEPEDISQKDYVLLGTKAEEPLRNLFALTHKEYEVSYNQHDIIFQDSRPHLRVTLDGELKEIATGKMGVLEIKKCECNKKQDWHEWDGKIKDSYYAQVLAQLSATGYDFCCVYALLIGMDGDAVLRTYMYTRDMCLPDIELVEHEADKYWNGYVIKDIRPPVLLPEIMSYGN